MHTNRERESEWKGLSKMGRIMLQITHRCSSAADTWITPHIHNVDTQHIDICLRSASTRACIQSQQVVHNATLPAQQEFDLQISFVLTTEHQSGAGEETTITPSEQ